MTNARGDEAKLLARQQAAFGTAEASAAGAFMALPFYSYNVSQSEDRTEDDAIYGDAFPGDSVQGLRSLSGAMVVPIGINSFGWHLRSILGAPVTTGADPNYEHVFTPKAQPVIPVLTHGISHTRIGTHFVQDSLTCTSLEIAARKDGQRARATLNMMGRSEAKLGAVIDSAPILYEPDAVPVGFQGRALVGGAPVAEITGVDLTLTSGVEMDQETLNQSPSAAGFESPRWGLSGSVSARYRDNTWYDYGANNTAVNLQLELLISATKSLLIDMPDVRFEMTGIPIEGRGPISAQFNWRAERPAPGVELATITLKNQTADYANPA
ncbi:hypothetical protein FIU97_14620 [Roseivivax sp. THAF40]|uniref:phage tail tube protein n=1 Tax=unclassified Roseivivax TaxID=2639302 RepID=UPI001267FD8E|nr:MULTISPECIES: phage tail tube protein [unclassified Roseivivax]QFS83983.1 hypothetical protein FIV09_14195 [Roseivivax sp. THAF197b]QFT47813.1 hypothetical protein FIU97_14620 [Roseivivax sp. THAF40]